MNVLAGTCDLFRHVEPGAPLGGDAHTGLLYSHPLAQKHLAPSLLLLYGDVEHTGYVPFLFDSSACFVSCDSIFFFVVLFAMLIVTPWLLGDSMSGL